MGTFITVDLKDSSVTESQLKSKGCVCGCVCWVAGVEDQDWITNDIVEPSSWQVMQAIVGPDRKFGLYSHSV